MFWTLKALIKVLGSLPLLVFDSIDTMAPFQKENFEELLSALLLHYLKLKEHSASAFLARSSSEDAEKLEDAGVAAFFEWLDILPSQSLNRILELAKVSSLPVVNGSSDIRSSRSAGNLLHHLQGAKEAKLEAVEEMNDVQFHMHHSALKRGIFPMNIAIQWKDQEYLGFIKMVSRNQQKSNTGTKRLEEFKDLLYQQNYFDSPIWTVKDEDGMNLEVASDNITKKLVGVLKLKTRK